MRACNFKSGSVEGDLFPRLLAAAVVAVVQKAGGSPMHQRAKKEKKRARCQSQHQQHWVERHAPQAEWTPANVSGIKLCTTCFLLFTSESPRDAQLPSRLMEFWPQSRPSDDQREHRESPPAEGEPVTPFAGGGFEPEEARSSTSSSQPATKASVCRPDAGLRCIGPALAWPECSKACSYIHESASTNAQAANRGRPPTDHWLACGGGTTVASR